MESNKEFSKNAMLVITICLVIVVMIAVPVVHSKMRNERLAIGDCNRQMEAIANAVGAYHNGFNQLPEEIIFADSSKTWDGKTIVTIGTYEYYYQGDVCTFSVGQILPLTI